MNGCWASGSDIDCVLEGLGEKRGLARTFKQIGEISLFLAYAQAAQGLLPFLQNLPVLHNVSSALDLSAS